MANNKKANDAILMAILQDIQSALSGNPIGSAASTGAIVMSDIKRDGADQGDVHNVVANSWFDQTGDTWNKIKLQFQEHPEILDDLTEIAKENGVEITSLEDLGKTIFAYLKTRKYAQGGQFETKENWIKVQIEKQVFNLLVAETEEEKERGLQDVESMEPNEGMLFDYSDDPQASISFWMKDTTIPLDIVFVNQDGVVISVKQGEPLSEEIITEDSEFVSCVIELNINSGVQPGDKTDLFEELQGSEEEPKEEEIPTGNNELHVYGSDGEVQATLQGSERIFSRKSTAVLIKKAKLAYETKDDKDYKALGRYAFDEMRRQDGREPEYVDN